MMHPVLGHYHILVTLRNVFLGSDTRPQIHDEAEDVKGVDECDEPFEDGCDVLVFGEGCADEDDGKDGFDEDECEFDPEADGEDSMVAVVNAQSLVFCAEEDR